MTEHETRMLYQVVFNKGYQAHVHKRTFADNPYNKHSDKCILWDEGYRTGISCKLLREQLNYHKMPAHKITTQIAKAKDTSRSYLINTLLSKIDRKHAEVESIYVEKINATQSAKRSEK